MGYIAYYRVSTRKQGDSGLGLESQKAMVSHFYVDCKKCEGLVSSYTEVASAKDMNRPMLREAIRECIKGNHTLVVAKIDRLSRKTEDALKIYGQLQGRLESCDIPNLDKFSLTLFMAIADRERELIGIRTKVALQAKRERGETLGNASNLTKAGQAMGSKAGKQKAKDAYKGIANYVCLMRDSEGLTYQAIADTLNSEGHLTRKNASFTSTTVMRIYKRHCKEG